MKSVNYPLSNMQLELLKLFSRDIADNDVVEIKKLFVKYLSQKLDSSANKDREEKNWTNDDMDKLLNSRLRTPYKDQD